MRTVLIVLISVSFLSTRAQAYLPGVMNASLFHPFPAYSTFGDSSHQNKSFYVSRYVGLSSGFTFFNGGNVNYFAVPVGLQLNHPLNNNLIAFAGVSAAPTLLRFNSAFLNSANSGYPGNNFSNTYHFGLDSRVELGLTYVNDAKTFSISGSIGVERSSSPYLPVQRQNAKKQ